MPWRPWLLVIMSLAMLASCGERAPEQRARRAPAPQLQQDPYPGPAYATTEGDERYELDWPIEPERGRVECDLIPPPERARTAECKTVPPQAPPHRVVTEPYPDL